MRTVAAFFALILALPAFAATGDQDVVFRRNGALQPGRITTMDDRFLRLEVQLITNQPPAEVSIPLNEIERVVFAERPEETELLANPIGKLGEITSRWTAKEPFLSIENSNAGAFGLAYANALINSTRESDWQAGYDIFLDIEGNDWSPTRNALAKQGKLRAMIRLGRAEEAVEEAKTLAASSEDPAVLIEATYVLADNAYREFTQLMEDNPRWEEDIFVRPERHRLYNEALNYLLHPYLFHGTEAPQATRGMWQAVQLYQQANELERASALANDIVELYPDAAEAPLASTLLTEINPEKPPTETTNE